MPKLRKSERESSWAPKSDSLWRCLANIPSSKSQIPAIKIHKIAKLKSASRANLIELKPKHRPDSVMTFGSKILKSIFFILSYLKDASIDSPAITLSPTEHFVTASSGI